MPRRPTRRRCSQPPPRWRSARPRPLRPWSATPAHQLHRDQAQGAFLIDVQAHTLLVDRELQDVYGDSRDDVTVKREGGQLLVLRLPGA